MTHYLQSVLEMVEPLLNAGLAKLEKSTGNSGVDTRLIADILEKAHKTMRLLGLDTHDTTGRELYHSLLSIVKSKDFESILIDTDYVLYNIDNKVVSFNLIDVIENFHHELPYEKQVVSHGQRSLRGEIIGRYIKHARTNKATTLEIASSFGLSPEQDTWYNNAKAYRKITEKIRKGTVK